MRDELIYKGYRAEIFESDNRVNGTVTGLSDYLFFISEKDNSVESVFSDCIEEYCKVCQLVGKDVEKPFYGKIEISLDRKKKAILTEEARRKKLSLEELISDILRQYVDFIK